MPLSILLAAVAADPAALDRITVTARRPDAARPEAVARLDADTVEALGATHANELLARVPGAWISRGSGQEQLTAIRSPVLTGVGACGAFLFLEDGVPIRPAGFCNVNQLFELGTELAGAVEVLRGPGAAVHGSNALHGVINVRPLAPEAGTRVGMEAGPERYRRLRAGGGDGDTALPWRVDAYGVSTGSFREEEGYDQHKLTAQLGFPEASGAPRLLFSAANLNQETAGFVAGEGAYRDARRRTNANPEAFRDARAFRLQGRWEWALSDADGLTWVPYARRDDMRFIQHFTPGKPLEDNGSRSVGSQLMWRRAGIWDLQLGLDVEVARGELLEFQPEPLTDSTPFQNAQRPEGRHYDYRVEAQNLAAFAEAGRQIGARTRLLLGARLESLRYDYDNRMDAGNLREDGTPCPVAGGCLFNRPADRRDRFEDLAAQIGLRHALGERWQLNARLAHAFRFPQAAELYRLQRGQDVADLKPETLHGVELGLAHAGPALSLRLDAYAYDKRDVILRDAAGFNISDGRTTHRGIEAEGRWTFATRSWLAGNAAYGVQRYAFDRAIAGGETIVRGNEVDTAPRVLGGLRLGHDAGAAGGFELEWLHYGAYFLDAANTARYPGHDLLHLRWQRAIGADWRVSARLMNLTDRRYAERADLGFGEFRYFPGAGRALFLGLSWAPTAQ